MLLNTRKSILSNRLLISIIFSSIILITLSLLTVFNSILSSTPAQADNQSSLNSEFEVEIEEVLAFSLTNCDNSNSSVLSINITPNSSGVFKSACQTTTVDTNAPGYSLSISQNNGLPPEETAAPVINPPGYNDFATDSDVDNFYDDLYNGITSLPEGANCWVGMPPGVNLQDGFNEGQVDGWYITCDDGSNDWEYCAIQSITNGVGVCKDFEYDQDSNIIWGNNTMCYVQDSSPGWCTDNED
ncbi:hypothetical protein LJC64_02255, partial [Ruminococcaceae bacterium OttesenSCG-928-A11]|nr:hypothetical protein [Ruminococcaceae bacterium OttesenSCG-928-A11]